MEGANTVDKWGIILNNGTELYFRPGFNQESIPGFTGRHLNRGSNILLITVNTTETSVTGLSCYSIVGLALVSRTINVTIYGK